MLNYPESNSVANAWVSIGVYVRMESLIAELGDREFSTSL